MRRSAVVAALAAAEALAASLRAVLEEPDSADQDLLDARQTMAAYKVGRDGLVAAAGRGELTLVRGARNRVMVERAELERWLRARPHPTQRRSQSKRPAPANDLAAWEAEAERELLAMGGG